VVQPTDAAADGLRPAIREFHALAKAGVPTTKLVFALNRIDTEAEENDARHYIVEAGYETLPGSLPEKAGYRMAQNAGYAAAETRFAPLNGRADALIQALINRIE
jgi:chromosome partitioning protein